MEPLLYLDTARLGQMSPAAQRAQQDFARLAGEMGAAIQFEEFLQHGVDACDSKLRRRLPGLASWRGISNLKQSLRQLAGFDDDLPLLLATRSAELMRFAAILLCFPCRNILVTDLGWPPYHRILSAECRRARRRLTTVELADDVLRGRINADEVVARVYTEFVKNRCDGLFLTAVNNRGVRLPVEKITRTLGNRSRFVVVDAAQDFCHVGLDAPPDCFDLYLAGSHKWLGGYHPLGMALYGRQRSKKMIETLLQRSLNSSDVDDPLLRFVERLHNGQTCDREETVNLAALFSCAGAVQDAKQRGGGSGRLKSRLGNAVRVADVATAAGWRSFMPEHSLRSGILLLEATTPKAKCLHPEYMRTLFHRHRVALTAYEGGVVRLSMPAAPLTSNDLAMLASAFTSLA